MNTKIQKLQAQLEAERLKEATKDLGIQVWSLAFLEKETRITETRIDKIIRYKDGTTSDIHMSNGEQYELNDKCTIADWKLYIKCF